MQALGPVGSATGQRAAGYTDAQVSWRHAREMDDGACRLRELEVDVAIVTTLPEWVRPRNGRSGLAVQWKSFMAKLRAHEATHRQHGLQSAAAVREAILALPPQSDCRRLAQTIDRAARREIRRHAALSRRYDALTDFGAKEGVRLEVRGPAQTTR
ncbi:DUF922 domain-containing protein [Lysobacter koreensis]|uniref:DUF922 domain-containing protein n=1 Tax=Lysobacter koreensis TaxID=266122 RepID=A0ABW2YQ45_9GAMM